MKTEDLFEEILIKPASDEGANRLFIVTGYATAAMAFHHLDFLKNSSINVNIQLLVGMCPSDGLSLSNHKGFQKLVKDDFSSVFNCSYVMNRPAVHSKVYAWFRDKKPVKGYIGSANYTQYAFGRKQREIIDECDPLNALNYFNKISSDTIYCTHPDAEIFIQIYHDKFYIRKEKVKELFPDINEKKSEFVEDVIGLPSVTVSLLDRSNNLPQRSGLNWGQRPEEGREPNQAYIRLSSDIYRTDFFPPRGNHFTLLTDDSKVLICSRAQDNSKAIHTPHNNSLIGVYFRNRLNIPSGKPVSIADLQRYGRSDITFYKIDDETFFMDFSV